MTYKGRDCLALLMAAFAISACMGSRKSAEGRSEQDISALFSVALRPMQIHRLCGSHGYSIVAVDDSVRMYSKNEVTSLLSLPVFGAIASDTVRSVFHEKPIVIQGFFDTTVEDTVRVGFYFVTKNSKEIPTDSTTVFATVVCPKNYWGLIAVQLVKDRWKRWSVRGVHYLEG